MSAWRSSPPPPAPGSWRVMVGLALPRGPRQRPAHLRKHAPRPRSRKIYHSSWSSSLAHSGGECWCNPHKLQHIRRSARLTEVCGNALKKRGWLRTSLLGQLFSCQRTPRRPTCPSMRPDRPTPHAERPRRGHAWRLPPALPLPLNAPAWLSQNAIAVSGGPPGATALSCSHAPQESTRMHRPTLRRT